MFIAYSPNPNTAFTFKSFDVYLYCVKTDFQALYSNFMLAL